MSPPSSSKTGGIKIQKVRGLQQQHHFSPSSIGNLVKHFPTSMNNFHPSPAALNCRTQEEGTVVSSDAPKSTHRQQKTPHNKRQSRRRLHSTRPYQHRNLNMAEARKEIVTALKFHRASSNHHHHHQHQPSCDQHGQILSPTINPTAYTSSSYANNNNNFSNPVHDFSFLSSSSSSLSQSNPLDQPLVTPHGMPQSSLCLFSRLPNRTLGLNLNFQDFENLLNAPICSKSSYYPSLSAPADAVDCTVVSQAALKSMEHHHQVTTTTEDDDAACAVFDGPMEFPDWLSANERCSEHCSQEFLLDPPTLPW